MCAIGDNVVDWYPQERIAFPGGSAANSSVFARRMGIEASYIGIFGNDVHAEHISGSLTHEGVDISLAQWCDEPSSRTDVLIDDAGDRTFTAYVPPQSRIVLDDAKRRHLVGASWIHSGHSSATEDLLAELSEFAPVSFDFSSKDVEYAEAILAHVRFATFSRDEASIDEARELLDFAVSCGVTYAVVTRGAKGAIAVTPEGSFAQTAAPAEVIDTIGAGDAFQTCFIANVIDGNGTQDSLRKASEFAARVCGHRGAFGHGQHIELAI
ncbi:PfkB family carbohydrate kinase [Microbacterium sp.]|uniref:PfkB family carbohydrate kinase n=1 Tax=Microbacterium sp. TaxID=51671 RepID=UPI002606F7A9|nr:PfkB family carbohydrate kinase [Microbacterium sp.]